MWGAFVYVLPVSYLMQLRANFCQCPTSGSCSCALWGLCRSQQAFLFFAAAPLDRAQLYVIMWRKQLMEWRLADYLQIAAKTYVDVYVSHRHVVPELTPSWGSLETDLKFVKKFTRPNFRAKDFFTLKTRKTRLFSPAINSKNASLSVIWPSFD